VQPRSTNDPVGGDSNITITNKSFDLVPTVSKITLINDSEKFKYDVFAYTADPYFAGNQTF
jgi:hypothetical protein